MRTALTFILTIALLSSVTLAQGPRQPRRPVPPANRPVTPPTSEDIPSWNRGAVALPPWGWRTGMPRPAIIAGNNPRVRVQAPSRLDWAFPLSPVTQTTIPRDVQLYDSTFTSYHLWVPLTYRHAQPHPLILCISGKAVPDEYLAWGTLCRTYGVLFAVAYDGGDEVHPAKRMRLSLDVLDDLRRRMAIDADRIYVAGFSEGARTASELAYAYPEAVGGVVAIGGASGLRGEPWMRDRVKERLSVALVTGELDPAKREMETLRHPPLRDQGFTAKLWTVPRVGHALPPQPVLEDVYAWLETGVGKRQALTQQYPTTRMPQPLVPAPDFWAFSVVDEAKQRGRDPATREMAALQLEGVVRRWPTAPAAKTAKALLEKYDNAAKTPWKQVYEARQLEFFAQEAKALDEYLAGPLPRRDMLAKIPLTRELIALYEAVEKHGPDTPEADKAKKRAAELRKLVPAGR